MSSFWSKLTGNDDKSINSYVNRVLIMHQQAEQFGMNFLGGVDEVLREYKEPLVTIKPIYDHEHNGAASLYEPSEPNYQVMAEIVGLYPEIARQLFPGKEHQIVQRVEEMLVQGQQTSGRSTKRRKSNSGRRQSNSNTLIPLNQRADFQQYQQFPRMSTGRLSPSTGTYKRLSGNKRSRSNGGFYNNAMAYFGKRLRRSTSIRRKARKSRRGSNSARRRRGRRSRK